MSPALRRIAAAAQVQEQAVDTVVATDLGVEGRRQQRALTDRDDPTHGRPRPDTGEHLDLVGGEVGEFVGVELFGRRSGETALLAGFLSQADRTVIAEVPADLDVLLPLLLEDKRANPQGYAICMISEGAAMAGEADSLQGAGGESLYRACTSEHHHHLICRVCGLTLEIEAHRVETWADEVAAAHGFASPSHTIDIFGVCAACRS